VSGNEKETTYDPIAHSAKDDKMMIIGEEDLVQNSQQVGREVKM